MLLEKVINTAKEMDGDPVLFLTHTQDRKKNPLPWDLKVKYVKAAVGNQINVCEDDGVKTAFDFLVWVNDHQYKKVIIIVGGDRVEEFKTFFEKYNGQETPRGKYTFDDIKVVSAGARDPDGEGVSSYSATKARNAALDGDFETFKQIVGVNSEKLASDIFNTLRKFMGLGENVINTTSVSLNKRELTHFFKDLPESVVWDLLEGISLQEAAVLHYLGTCVNIDNKGNNYGFDPTEFAQAEERAVEEKIDLDSREFWNRAVAPSEVRSALLNNLKVWYAYDSILGVSWAYDPDEDIHYIFEGTPLHEGVELTPPSEELNRLVYDIGQDDNDDRFEQSYEDDVELARRDGYFESPTDFDESLKEDIFGSFIDPVKCVDCEKVFDAETADTDSFPDYDYNENPIERSFLRCPHCGSLNFVDCLYRVEEGESFDEVESWIPLAKEIDSAIHLGVMPTERWIKFSNKVKLYILESISGNLRVTLKKNFKEILNLTMTKTRASSPSQARVLEVHIFEEGTIEDIQGVYEELKLMVQEAKERENYEKDYAQALRDLNSETPKLELMEASRSVSTVSFRFPTELVGFSDIHSTSQYSHVLTGFGRGVIGPNGEVKIGPAGSSHRDLSKTLGDTKRFYWGYSREKEVVYVVSKNAMDTDILKNKKILMVILSNVFDLVKLSVAPGGLKIVEAAQVKTKTAAKKKK